MACSERVRLLSRHLPLLDRPYGREEEVRPDCEGEAADFRGSVNFRVLLVRFHAELPLRFADPGLAAINNDSLPDRLFVDSHPGLEIFLKIAEHERARARGLFEHSRARASPSTGFLRIAEHEHGRARRLFEHG